MASHQTQSGNNFIMPILLLLISIYVISDTLSNDKEENLAVALSETSTISYESVTTSEAIQEEKVVINEDVSTQSIATIEPAKANDSTAPELAAPVLEAENVNLPDDNTVTIISQPEETTEVTEPGVTSSSTALAENVALEIFEVNTSTTTEETQADVNSAIVDQEAAPEEVISQAKVESQEQDIPKTDPAIPADEEQAESMPAATAPITPTPTTTTAPITESKTETAQATAEQTEINQTEKPEFITDSSLQSPLQESTKAPIESIDAKGSENNDLTSNKKEANTDTSPANGKPTFVTQDENNLIFISPEESNPYSNDDAATQNRNGTNYTQPPQNQLNPNYAATPNQYQQYLYEQQQRQYYATMQQQLAQQRAQQQAYQQAYQNEMKARQRYLTEMKAKQGQHNRALATNPTYKNQQKQLDTEQKIQQIKQKISQLNEEIRQLRLNPTPRMNTNQEPSPNTTAPVSKQM